MFLKKIKTEGIAHLSYITGDGLEAVVIDPRRDYEIYLDIAKDNGVQITHIFETHRNEDFVSGSLDLARQTGATIYHGAALNFSYGETVSEGDQFDIGDVCLKILETPGHTDESISIVVTDKNYDASAVAVFTGDTLFVGDVGRTDFYPDKLQEKASALFDSIFKKILPLGDQTILYPAHGAGSVCGNNMASRDFSTIGHERLNNPLLKNTDRHAFVALKVNENHYKPPYFKKMEKYNQQGPPPLEELPLPVPMNAEMVSTAFNEGALLLDLRSPEAYAGAFIPGSLAIPLELLSAYAGYFINYSTDLILISESRNHVERAVRQLTRIGYDRVIGYLKGGMSSWETSGRDYDQIGAVNATALDKRLREKEEFTLLDVRKTDEFEQYRLKHAVHIFLGDLERRITELDPDTPVVTFCGSGKRAIIAASLLKQAGFMHVEDSLGSMQACRKAGCEMIQC